MNKTGVNNFFRPNNDSLMETYPSNPVTLEYNDGTKILVQSLM